ncbi:hypothetical protein ESA94_17400 [Lacibacter luteus]|uniref:TonB-dependent receptor plug domain-containing protein n=1 Tax=Lacibacter luteus TaxID=2508719 RepID=A0A4Q1CEY4_9BACT|nr:Plug domain-containing protein [Lacibacter luteus]RXK58415.1 hypothetical protein ESA94_17400 [Lacibacter luteus]
MKKQILLLLLVASAVLTQAQVYRSKQTITREEQLNEQYCSSLFKTAHGTIFDFTDEVTAQGFTNVLQWLQGRVAGLTIYTTRTGVTLPFIRNQLATVFIDEMPVEHAYAGIINPADIAMIKIIKGPFGGNMLYGSGGAVAIYTLRGDEG